MMKVNDMLIFKRSGKPQQNSCLRPYKLLNLFYE